MMKFIMLSLLLMTGFLAASSVSAETSPEEASKVSAVSAVKDKAAKDSDSGESAKALEKNERVEAFTKVIESGRSDQKNDVAPDQACSSFGKREKTMCLQGYYYEAILKEIEKNRAALNRRAPESPSISAEEEHKVAWMKSFGWILLEINQHITDFESAPELLRNKTYQRKYWMYLAEGWVLKMTSQSGPKEALDKCSSLFNQKHICLWAAGRASYYYRYGFGGIDRPRKEFISGFLFSKGLSIEEDISGTDPGVLLANYVLGQSGSDGSVKTRLKKCLEKAHSVECLNVFSTSL